MTPQEIQAAIESVRFPPDDVLRSAVERATDLAPSVIALAEGAADGTYLTLPEQRLLFAGIHALGAARCTALYRPLMRLLRRPEEDLDHWLGDSLTASIPDVAFSVFDGDPAPLIAAIEDRSTGPFLRWSLFEVLAQLTVRGLAPREPTIDLIDRFERDRLADDGDCAWHGWRVAIMALGLVERFDAVRATQRAGRFADRDVDWQEWDEEMRRVAAGAPPDRYFTGGNLATFDDPVVGLSWIDPKFRAQSAPTASVNGDPAPMIALGDDEIAWLRSFLSGGRVAKAAMPMEQLDGFVTGLLAGPAAPRFDQHVDRIWRGFDPRFDSAEQKAYVLALLERHWNSLALRLDRQIPPAPIIARYPPQMVGRAWAEGFLLCIDDDSAPWESLVFDAVYSPFLDTVVALEQNEWQPRLEGRPQRTRQQYVEALPAAVLGIHRFWRRRPGERPPRLPPRALLHRKIGRNERCPCGSGQKYKRCCGVE